MRRVDLCADHFLFCLPLICCSAPDWKVPATMVRRHPVGLDYLHALLPGSIAPGLWLRPLAHKPIPPQAPTRRAFVDPLLILGIDIGTTFCLEFHVVTQCCLEARRQQPTHWKTSPVTHDQCRSPFFCAFFDFPSPATMVQPNPSFRVPLSTLRSF